ADIDKVVIDEANSTVYLEDPKMSLDVGSIAKGYATEQVAQLAMAKGYNSALLSVGGNIRAIGNKGVNNEQWNVGIQNPNPDSAQKSLATVLLTGKSLVTSGIYERYYT
ncbi:FAD:protein FMN transferase, partial [Clostridium sp. 3-3]|uniref:FAD:protein FMN transferase n=1 Tax=Clostridium sp. 3-3 TaxID=2070757 RepID=UPI000D3FD901